MDVTGVKMIVTLQVFRRWSELNLWQTSPIGLHLGILFATFCAHSEVERHRCSEEAAWMPG